MITVNQMRYILALRYLVYLVVYFIALFIAALTMPLVPLFANKLGDLPKWLSWFQTPDSTVDGDSNWEASCAKTLGELPEWLQTYLRRLGWLYRNPIYGFSIYVLGAPKTSNKPTIISSDGFHRQSVYLNKYFMVYQMNDDPKTNRRTKIYIGWKLQTEAFDKYPFVFLINPFQHYK